MGWWSKVKGFLFFHLILMRFSLTIWVLIFSYILSSSYVPDAENEMDNVNTCLYYLVDGVLDFLHVRLFTDYILNGLLTYI